MGYIQTEFECLPFVFPLYRAIYPLESGIMTNNSKFFKYLSMNSFHNQNIGKVVQEGSGHFVQVFTAKRGNVLTQDNLWSQFPVFKYVQQVSCSFEDKEFTCLEQVFNYESRVIYWCLNIELNSVTPVFIEILASSLHYEKVY